MALIKREWVSIAIGIVSILLSGCSPQPPRHQILGTNYGWVISEHNVQVLLDAQVDKLRVRHVRLNDPDCVIGYEEHLEISGAIGPDSTEAIGRLLPKLSKCIQLDGKQRANVVYLSSGGGLLQDGYKLGELFRQYQVNTVITGGQMCASSCAIAFLGGAYRTMQYDALLLFHAPYVHAGIAIDCSDRGQVQGLRNYYHGALGAQDGEYLLNRTMSYCTASDGWTLNADGAKLFGVTTEVDMFRKN